MNILNNAIKYTEHGEISISTNRNEKNVLIKVSDTGIEIQAEHLPNIFDRFHRVEESRTLRAAGLGLAIAKEIVRAHHREIEVHSKIGQGTILVISLS